MSDAFWMALIGGLVTIICRVLSWLENRSIRGGLKEVKEEVKNGKRNGHTSGDNGHRCPMP